MLVIADAARAVGARRRHGRARQRGDRDDAPTSCSRARTSSARACARTAQAPRHAHRRQPPLRARRRSRADRRRADRAAALLAELAGGERSPRRARRGRPGGAGPPRDRVLRRAASTLSPAPSTTDADRARCFSGSGSRSSTPAARCWQVRVPSWRALDIERAEDALRRGDSPPRLRRDPGRAAAALRPRRAGDPVHGGAAGARPRRPRLRRGDPLRLPRDEAAAPLADSIATLRRLRRGAARARQPALRSLLRDAALAAARPDRDRALQPQPRRRRGAAVRGRPPVPRRRRPSRTRRSCSAAPRQPVGQRGGGRPVRAQGRASTRCSPRSARPSSSVGRAPGRGAPVPARLYRSACGIGWFGRLDAESPFPLFAAELFFDALRSAPRWLRVVPPSRYPGVAVDLTLTHSLALRWAEIARAIGSAVPAGAPGVRRSSIATRARGAGGRGQHDDPRSTTSPRPVAHAGRSERPRGAVAKLHERASASRRPGRMSTESFGTRLEAPRPEPPRGCGGCAPRTRSSAPNARDQLELRAHGENGPPRGRRSRQPDATKCARGWRDLEVEIEALLE